jgi:hypothetical protein
MAGVSTASRSRSCSRKSSDTELTGTVGANTDVTATKKHAHQKPDALPKAPKGETTRAVPDHPAYVEIMSGPRNGMFINMTHNEPRGEAFVLVRKHDRDLHIYGTGKDRRVIISWHKDQPAHRDADKTTAPAATDSKSSTGGATAPSA